MAVILRNLSEFKRFLGKPGATIQVVRNTFMDRQPSTAREAYRDKGMYAPRSVRALSRKAAVFALQGHPGTVWLYWDKGARGWSFSGDHVTVPLVTGLGAPDEIVYRCSYADGFEPRARQNADRAEPRRIPWDGEAVTA
ncbi:hypothetical protein [Methylobacterium trifolii]|uniref:Uncharacterized protein n=1 Tax=Methylobacterium trifolii TaxID=1003092 RepID=A0ABQ4U4V4_9HYPH|nr:hypothetical protein [Methylobacterium trifolii]GJE62474.1 hypothetical protein MPOCJGCO_4607 [Methylobacterium trifolii]